jgi:hypothetical protein
MEITNPNMKQNTLDRTQKNRWEKNEDLILKAIRKIESEDMKRPYARISEIQKETKLTRETIYTHLVNPKSEQGRKYPERRFGSLVAKGLVDWIGRGQVSSAHAKAVEMFCRKLFRSHRQETPELQIDDFERITSETFRPGIELGIFKGTKDDELEGYRKQYTKDTAARLTNIQHATEISIFTREPTGLDEVAVTKLKRAIAEFLIRYVEHERNKNILLSSHAEVSKDQQRKELLELYDEEERRVLEDCIMQITIDFDMKASRKP